MTDDDTLSLGYTDDGQPLTDQWFDEERRISDADDVAEPGGSLGDYRGSELKRPYSITGDILAYRRCKRQYGYFNEHGFTPARATQLFFGRVVHETLDLAHKYYRGELEEGTEGEVPSDEQIEEFFTRVADSLRAQNMEISEEAEAEALRYVQRFNREEGPRLYQYVDDTEHPLRTDRDDYILEGVVDVLLRDDESVEIWDYKAGQRPDESELEDYETQLYTYATLYRERNNGELPDRGVIYFLGEETRDEAQFVIDFEGVDIDESLEDFERTVREIKRSRENQDWENIEDPPSEQTCQACEIKRNCPAYDGSD